MDAWVVQEILSEAPPNFGVNSKRERYMITSTRDGYLRRVR
jgi:cephalosporin hydroxylase